MKRLHRTLWVGAALLAAPLPAAAQDLCAALNRIAAASRERVPFASLRDAAKAGTLVPGFREEDCRVTPGLGVHCYRNIAPRSLALAVLEPALRQCVGVAPILGPTRRRTSSDEPDYVFSVRGLRYEIRNSCDHSCRAGLLASVDVTLERARRRRR